MGSLDVRRRLRSFTVHILKENIEMKKSLVRPSLALMSFLSLAIGAAAAKAQGPVVRESVPWNVDAPHTEVNFSVKHFFTPVTGTFRSYEVDLSFDAESPENSSVNVTIDVASVDTNNERRDNHLRSEDFFNAEEYPRMTFRSTSVRQVGPDRLLATGDLTIKGTTMEIELPISLLGVKDIPAGPMQDMLGGVTQVASFEAKATLDRREFEVGVANWAQTMIVGGEVEVTIALEANRK
jgi:polyisoprenoid-binding protein YceI